MEILYLLRHAEAGRGDPPLADFDRPLNGRGRASIPAVAGVLREKGVRPGLVISSPALRARETAELLAGELGLGAPISFDASVYEAHTLDLLRVVNGADESVAELLVVGHNPGLENLVERLTGERVRLATAALVRIELEIGSWAEAGEGRGRLAWVAAPSGPGAD